MATGSPAAGDRERRARIPVPAFVAPSVSATRRPSTVDALGGRGQRLGAHRPVDGEVVGERVGLLAHAEVGEHAVGARVGKRDGERPCAVGVLGRVQVLEAGHVAAHDDEVHALGVLDVEVAHGLSAAVDDPEGQLERLALRRGPARELERESLLADREAAHRLRRHRRAIGHRPMPGLVVVLPGCTSRRLPANAAPANTNATTSGEPGQSAGDVHAVTCAWRGGGCTRPGAAASRPPWPGASRRARRPSACRCRSGGPSSAGR